MLEVGTSEVIVALAVFWVLLPIVVWGRRDWAVLAWLIMGNLDPTEPGFASTGSFGLVNAVKALGIPIILLWRFRTYPMSATDTIPARLWIALAAYASVASLWSPFPLAALKLVGNMVGILLAVIVLEKAARAGILNGTTITWFIVATITLGVIQTYVFGGKLYGYDGPDEPSRFSSFIFAQQYAAVLVAFLALALWHYQFSPMRRVVLGSGVMLALVLNGSRTWFVGASLVIAVYCWMQFRRVVAIVAFVAASIALAALLVFNLSPSGVDLVGDAPGRMVATVNAVLLGTDTAQRAGLRNLSFRIIVYESILQELQNGTNTQLIFGRGTSSGGALSMRIFPHDYNIDHLDANRTLHDEWLRALYEWGIIGLLLLVGVFASLAIGLIYHYRLSVWKPPSAALLSFLPAFLAALSTENVLAGAGNCLAFSLSMLVAMLWAPIPVQPTREPATELVLDR